MECWAIKRQQEHKVNVAEMLMLRSMCGKARQYKIRNEDIQVRPVVASFVKKSMLFERT
jgi:hypothetical protein